MINSLSVGAGFLPTTQKPKAIKTSPDFGCIFKLTTFQVTPKIPIKIDSTQCARTKNVELETNY